MEFTPKGFNMKVSIKIKTVHKLEPVEADISVEFDKGEYLEVIQAMPAVISQVIQVKKMAKAKNNMRKGK